MLTINNITHEYDGKYQIISMKSARLSNGNGLTLENRFENNKCASKVLCFGGLNKLYNGTHKYNMAAHNLFCFQFLGL